MRMIKNKLKRLELMLFFMLTASCAFGQQSFRYQALLPAVKTGDFYQINLQPDLLAKCKAGLADIRIIDEHGKITPYIFGNNLPDKQQRFIELPQINKTDNTDSLTTFIAENKHNLIIDQLSMQVRNTVVFRTLNLSGSDDLKKWYAISENITLDHAGFNNNGSDYYEQLLSFPASRYRYLRVQINNKSKEPIEILKIGTYTAQPGKSEYIKLPDATITQNDSTKASTIYIKFKENYLINKLRLDFSGERFFKRNIIISQATGSSFETIGDTVISSSDTSGLNISAKSNTIKVEIINGDNPALTLRSVKSYQLKQSLISYLETGHHYSIVFGDQTASTPDYDIKFFTDSLDRPLQQINHGDITGNPLFKMAMASKDTIPAWMIWLTMALVTATLLFLTLKMTKEVGAKRNTE